MELFSLKYFKATKYSLRGKNWTQLEGISFKFNQKVYKRSSWIMAIELYIAIFTLMQTKT